MAPPPLPGRSRSPVPSMRVSGAVASGLGNPRAAGSSGVPDVVTNEEMEKLIPLVNKLQDALSLTESNESVSLPQIAVVGGQSSGKSSVLENIVGKSFLPRGQGIVTRRPLVLQLLNGPSEFGEFLHKPGEKFYDFEAIREEIEADTARICGQNKGLSTKAIHLKVQSPNVLNLTLIDLPGATKVAVGDQPEDIGEQIREMILSYVSKPTCIVLAVTPANLDLANSDALQISRMVDPRGDRTLGVITKLDLMDRGTDARDIFTAESSDLPKLKLGYVGVVNRSQADIAERKTIATARAAEHDFFASNPAYADLADRLGTSFLVEKCAQLLAANIKAGLPTLEREIAAALTKRRKEFADLGDQTPDAKKRRLTEALLCFCDRFQALVSGAPLPDRGQTFDKLSGGARVERVFREVFAPAVADLKVLDDLSPAEVQTLVRNVHGLGGGLFTPDQAFHQLVRRNVARLRKPATNCVELVHAELAALVADAADVPAIHAYPELHQELETFVANLLRENLDAAAAALQTLLDMELCRVNIAHPDFVGSKGITSLMHTVEHKLKGTHKPHRDLPEASPKPQQAPPEQPAEKSGGRFFTKPPKPTPAGKKVMTPEEAAAFREQMIAEVGPPSAKRNDDDDPPLGDISRFSHITHGLSLKEQVEVTVICELCSSYFAIVKKTFADLVPKAVTLKLVDATTRSVTTKVLAHLNTDDAVETLMAASPAIAALAEKTKTAIAALEQASAALKDMRLQR
mmetsp:Transcript_21723/g.68051  ORF Transcript_21723/g.68051 Transcript_21723/m.68051 type:complete len:747 (+) Transcript_21723:96-2336(+)